MKAFRLKTEHLKDPLGIDFTAPRLFWNCEGGVRQTAYQVICRDESENLLWDSGKIESHSMCTNYAGTPLHSRIRVLWQVRLWDESNVPGDWSEPAVFELGLLHASTLRPAASIRRPSMGKPLRGSRWPPASPTTASVCSTRPMI